MLSILSNTGLMYWVLFISLVGMGFFIYGKKRPDGYAIIAGLALMIYPIFISSLTWNIVTGAAICVAYIITKRIM